LQTQEFVMSSASMSFGRPGRLAVPIGSDWFGSITAMLIRGLRRLDTWSLAHQHRNEPRNAEEVMALARSLEAREPGLASDLRSAAMRSMDDDIQR
jgi:D-hexose-6-phosphate mutarotase